MHPDKFKRLQKSMDQIHDYVKGDDTKVKITAVKIEEPSLMSAKQIAKLREGMRLSQPVFAKLLNVSPRTVQAWEQGKPPVNGSALRLLDMIKKDPDRFLRMTEEDGIMQSRQA